MMYHGAGDGLGAGGGYQFAGLELSAAILPRPACGERVGVRGTLRESECVDRAPHPDLLRASFARLDPAKNGEKVKKPSYDLRCFAFTAIAAAAVRFSTPSLE